MDDNRSTPEAGLEDGDDDSIFASVQVWERGPETVAPVHVAFGRLAGRGVLVELDDGPGGGRLLSPAAAAPAVDVLLGRADPAQGVERVPVLDIELVPPPGDRPRSAVLMLSHRSVLSAGQDAQVTRDEADAWVRGRRPAALRPRPPADPDRWLAAAVDAEQQERAAVVRPLLLGDDDPFGWPNICCLLGWTCCQGQHPDPPHRPPDPVEPPPAG